MFLSDGSKCEMPVGNVDTIKRASSIRGKWASRDQ